jgi:hypothetical protein
MIFFMFSLCINSLLINNFYSFSWLIRLMELPEPPATLVFTGSHNQVQDGVQACVPLSCRMHEVVVEDQCGVSPNLAPTSSGLIVTVLPHQCLSSHQMPPIIDCYVFVVAYYGDFTNKCPAAGGKGTLHFTNKYPMGDTSFHY